MKTSDYRGSVCISAQFQGQSCTEPARDVKDSRLDFARPFKGVCKRLILITQKPAFRTIPFSRLGLFMSSNTRDRIKSESYFGSSIDFELSSIERHKSIIREPAADLSATTRSLYKLAAKYTRLILQRYSRGDAVGELIQYFGPMLNAWEEAEHLANSVWTPEQQRQRHAWTSNFDFYIICFWLVSLALTLDVPQPEWNRLLKLIGNDGEDRLLDQLIASRTPQRTIGGQVIHAKPYQRLMDCVNAAEERQPELLRAFLDKWYQELGAPPDFVATDENGSHDKPYWHGHHTLEGGYFGYWCLEAVAVVKVWGIDDGLCLGHRHYPGDLLRPGGPTTHGKQPVRQGARAGLPGDDAGAEPDAVAVGKSGLLTRLFRRR